MPKAVLEGECEALAPKAARLGDARGDAAECRRMMSLSSVSGWRRGEAARCVVEYAVVCARWGAWGLRCEEG
jgi:hypothetical protein